MAELPTTFKSVRLVERGASSAAADESSADGQWHKIEIHSDAFSVRKRNGGEETQPEEVQLTIRVKGFAYNHRDVWIRRGLYRGIQFGGTLGSDCMGVVVLPQEHELAGKEVLVYPAVNWLEDERGGPDVAGKAFGILGGTVETMGKGTFAEYLHVPASHCVASPPSAPSSQRPIFGPPTTSSSPVSAAASLSGPCSSASQLELTLGSPAAAITRFSWLVNWAPRVALTTPKTFLFFFLDTIEDDWPEQLASLLPPESPFLDAVIDSGGGDISQKTCPLLRPGGIIVNFGCTSGRPLTFTMREVLKNLELRGCTMGSLKEFKQMVQFVEEHKIQPVVHKTLYGFEQVEEGFQIMKAGQQFGKLVVLIDPDTQHKL
ncbi:hypothetical protein VP01_924g1 [Puccinia sorghi]|uniref:Enoyl reductase (ER) domain-containing protein n=1 Tax=Puccinia sorghi TaxID=27349 RepID=A0A0L6U773_9BASI|nr:hypothetical protein VP01_924g1 [Puccinia sorghi]